MLEGELHKGVETFTRTKILQRLLRLVRQSWNISIKSL